MQLLWIPAMLALAAGNSPAKPTAPTSDHTDPPPAASQIGQVLCWVSPSAANQIEQKELEDVLWSAATSAAPAHVRYKVERIRSIRRDVPRLGCDGLLDFTIRRSAGTRVMIVKSRDATLSEWTFTQTFEDYSADNFREGELAPVLRQLFEQIAPPAPEPIAPPKKKEEPAFVDEELRTEIRTQGTRGQGSPIADLWLYTGFSSRSLSDAPGTPVENAAGPLLGLGIDAHLAEYVGLKGHDLELNGQYGRQLVSATRGDAEIDVSSYRFRGTGTFRYKLRADLKVGPLVGYELLRFSLGPEAQALSVRYGVVRAGAGVRYVLPAPPAWPLTADVKAAVRLPLADSDATESDGNLAFDLSGALRLSRAEGLLAQLGFRYTQHGGNIGSDSFTDSYFDLIVGLGWQL